MLFSSKKSPFVVSLNLFNDKLRWIDQHFLRSVTHFIELTQFVHQKPKSDGFIFTTMHKKTYAYGLTVCRWLSLKYKFDEPQEIQMLARKSFKKVVYGSNMVVLLTENYGQIYLAGDSSYWPKPASASSSNTTLRLLSETKRFTDIACGHSHVLCLEDNGHLYAIGWNYYGQCTSEKDYDYENLIDTGLTNVKAIACGWFHSLAIVDGGKLYGWGQNKYGQINALIGEKFVRPRLMRKSLSLHENIFTAITAGDGHTFAIRSDRSIFGWGTKYYDFMQKTYGRGGICDKNKFLKIQSIMDYGTRQLLSIPSSNITLHLNEKYSQFHIYGSFDSNEPWTRKAGPRATMDAVIREFSQTPFTFGWSVNPIRFTIHHYHHILTESIVNTFDRQDLELNDLRFEFPEEKSGKYIHVQRSYLRLVSPYFERMLSTVWNGKNAVKITTVSYDIFFQYIRLLYFGQIHIDNTNVESFLDLAQCFLDDKLMRLCKHHVYMNRCQLKLNSDEQLEEFFQHFNIDQIIDADN